MTNMLLRMPSLSHNEEGLALEVRGWGTTDFVNHHSHFMRTAFEFKPSKV